MHTFLSRLLTPYFGERILSLIGILIILYLLKDFMMMFLVTFFFAYLFYSATQWGKDRLVALEKITPKPYNKIVAWIAREKVLLTIIYIIFACIVVIVIKDIGPTLITDLINLLQSFANNFPSIDVGISSLAETLKKWENISTQVSDFIKIISPNADTNTILGDLLHMSYIVFEIIMAYVLSFIWLLEYEKVQSYFGHLKKGPFAFFFEDVQIIVEKVQRSFGLVFHAQSKIAVVNTFLTVLGLAIIGIFFGGSGGHGYIFPYLWALGCITFLTSFVPILGTFIGGVPIILSGVLEYQSWSIVIAIIGMLTFIHIVEGYFLSPRIVGHSVKLPMPMVFLILLLAERFMGIAGFFLGVPMYLLFIELLGSVGKVVEKLQSASR